jgi:hypothetical protein
MRKKLLQALSMTFLITAGLSAAEGKKQEDAKTPPPKTAADKNASMIFGEIANAVYKSAQTESDEEIKRNTFNIPLLYESYNGVYGWAYCSPILLLGASRDNREWVDSKALLSLPYGQASGRCGGSGSERGKFDLFFSIAALSAYLSFDGGTGSPDKSGGASKDNTLNISASNDGTLTFDKSKGWMFFSLPLLSAGMSLDSADNKTGKITTDKVWASAPLLTMQKTSEEYDPVSKKKTLTCSETDAFPFFKMTETPAETESSSFYGLIYYQDISKDKDQFEILPCGLLYRYLKTPGNEQRSALSRLLYSSQKTETESKADSLWGILFDSSAPVGKNGDSEKFSLLSTLLYSSEENSKSLNRKFTPFFGYTVNKELNCLSGIQFFVCISKLDETEKTKKKIEADAKSKSSAPAAQK